MWGCGKGRRAARGRRERGEAARAGPAGRKPPGGAEGGRAAGQREVGRSPPRAPADRAARAVSRGGMRVFATAYKATVIQLYCCKASRRLSALPFPISLCSFTRTHGVSLLSLLPLLWLLRAFPWIPFYRLLMQHVLSLPFPKGKKQMLLSENTPWRRRKTLAE